MEKIKGTASLKCDTMRPDVRFQILKGLIAAANEYNVKFYSVKMLRVVEGEGEQFSYTFETEGLCKTQKSYFYDGVDKILQTAESQGDIISSAVIDLSCEVNPATIVSIADDHFIIDRQKPLKHSIRQYYHCAKCMADKPAEKSPAEWQKNEFGLTDLGWQIWCKRHHCNVAHYDQSTGIMYSGIAMDDSKQAALS